MLIREVRPEEKDLYNKVVNHPLQSWQWGEFREKTKTEVVRLGFFNNNNIQGGIQITLHHIPNLNRTIGYLPRCVMPNEQIFHALKDLGKRKKTIFFKIEPNFFTKAYKKDDHKPSPFKKEQEFLFKNGCVFGKPLFTKYSFILDLTQSDDQLLQNMKQKTRYNIRVAQKKEVKIIEDNSETAFDEYLDLTFNETTKRQRFYAHDREYHRKMWHALNPAGIAHLLKAVYNSQTLVTWILFTFNDALYYPYGASSSQNRDVMASNLMMWEAIRFGKARNLKYFDMWGSLGPDPDPKDPWYGFHHFKDGYGPTLMEFIGTYDFVIDPPMYQVYKLMDKARWAMLKIKASLPF
ncbi:peptidoglycan bridge formation glycyltransferase FemA/FemB family protein [Candidatus Beckwithbacteria bacterium]|nr:peptidoglycan bridge formation glycyltransferase FemA/FemB family protein [Candidatus Beckwithbacteria bacterium]